MVVTNSGRKLHEELNKLFNESNDIVVATAFISPGACEQLSLLRRAQLGRVRISVGRALYDGLSKPCKNYLLRLNTVAKENGGGVRVCPNSFHSKIYCGQNNSFVGSSNLTEHGLSSWLEANVLLQNGIAQEVLDEAVRIYDGAVEFDTIYDDIKEILPVKRGGKGADSIIEMVAEPNTVNKGVSISLLDNSGEVSPKAGLNWGFATPRKNKDRTKEVPRNIYDCYIRLPKSVLEVAEVVFGSTKSGTKFVAHTHDGRTFNLKLEGTVKDSVAKQISTDGDKSLLGKWMVHDCLGINPRRVVTRKDLDDYGRTSVEFYRTLTLEDGTAVVYLDFSRR